MVVLSGHPVVRDKTREAMAEVTVKQLAQVVGTPMPKRVKLT